MITGGYRYDYRGGGYIDDYRGGGSAEMITGGYRDDYRGSTGMITGGPQR